MELFKHYFPHYSPVQRLRCHVVIITFTTYVRFLANTGLSDF